MSAKSGWMRAEYDAERKKGGRTRKREKYLKEKIRQKKKSRVKRLRMMERR